MTQSNINIDILDYLGKHEGGVLALISINYNEEFYEGTFYYNNEMIALTPEDKLEEEIGCLIEEWENYNELVIKILKKVVPYNEIINITNNFDPSKYNIYLDSGTQSNITE